VLWRQSVCRVSDCAPSLLGPCLAACALPASAATLVIAVATCSDHALCMGSAALAVRGAQADLQGDTGAVLLRKRARSCPARAAALLHVCLSWRGSVGQVPGAERSPRVGRVRRAKRAPAEPGAPGSEVGAAGKQVPCRCAAASSCSYSGQTGDLDEVWRSGCMGHVRDPAMLGSWRAEGTGTLFTAVRANTAHTNDA